MRQETQAVGMEIQTGRCLFHPAAAHPVVAEATDYEYRTTSMVFRILRCEDCGLFVLDPRPSESALATIYPANYYAYRTAGYRPLVRRARALQLRGQARAMIRGAGRAVGEPLRILEVGCGQGDLLEAFRGLNPRFALAGLDYSESAIAAVRAKGFTGIAGDARAVRMDAGAFDLIICQQLIEHLHDPVGFLDRLRGWLAPAGKVIIDTPNADTLDRRLFGRYWGGYHVPRHFFLFTERNIGLLFEKAGARVERVTLHPSIAFWLWSLHNLIWTRWPAAWVDRFFALNNPLLLAPFLLLEAARKPFMKTATMRIVAGAA